MQKYPTGTKRAFFNPDQLALYVGAGQRANVETAFKMWREKRLKNRYLVKFAENCKPELKTFLWNA